MNNKREELQDLLLDFQWWTSHEGGATEEMLTKTADAIEKLFAPPAVMESDCEHEWINDSFDHFGFLTGQVCDKCGEKQSVP